MAYDITYAIVTEESAEHGDYAESGFLYEGLDFKEAVQRFESERAGLIEANEYPIISPRWFTAYVEQNPRTGDYREVSLHLPESVTPASRRRIARLLGVYGAE